MDSIFGARVVMGSPDGTVSAVGIGRISFFHQRSSLSAMCIDGRSWVIG